MNSKETKRTQKARNIQEAADTFRMWELVGMTGEGFETEVESIAGKTEDATAYYENAINGALYEYAELCQVTLEDAAEMLSSVRWL